jgi:hypothetical protein
MIAVIYTPAFAASLVGTKSYQMGEPVDESSPDYRPPPAPNPAADEKLAIQETSAGSKQHEAFELSPLAALKLVCAGIEQLVSITGDVPPTPPTNDDLTTTNMRAMQAEKENIVRSHSLTNMTQYNTSIGISHDGHGIIDGINFRKKPLAPLVLEPREPYIIIGENAEPLNLQHSAITRKFYSKKPPPISIEEYLMRIHKFCPMSTGVYLAASFYIHRLAVVERTIPVTKRNCHRLLLAGLRVAMKALEDFSYPHRRFSKVGGVGESELARLEISFCFLTNFDLRVTTESLIDHVRSLQSLVCNPVVLRSALEVKMSPMAGSRMSRAGLTAEVVADA